MINFRELIFAKYTLIKNHSRTATYGYMASITYSSIIRLYLYNYIQSRILKFDIIVYATKYHLY